MVALVRYGPKQALVSIEEELDWGIEEEMDWDFDYL